MTFETSLLGVLALVLFVTAAVVAVAPLGDEVDFIMPFESARR